MNLEGRKKLFIEIGIGVLIVAILGVLVYFLTTSKEKPSDSLGNDLLPDNLRFKADYESLNGQQNSDGKEYLTVEIPEDNPIVYKSDTEILDVLKNETALVYFGWEASPYCRSMVEPLIQIAKDNGIKKVYYVNILNIRDEYSVQDNQVVVDKKGSDAYYKILDFLSNRLDAYYVNDSEGKEYATGVTRLYAPTVIAVKDGEVKDYHYNTVVSQKDPFVPLTEEQRMELLGIYQNLYEPINENLCPAEGC